MGLLTIQREVLHSCFHTHISASFKCFCTALQASYAKHYNAQALPEFLNPNSLFCAKLVLHFLPQAQKDCSILSKDQTDQVTEGKTRGETLQRSMASCIRMVNSHSLKQKTVTSKTPVWASLCSGFAMLDTMRFLTNLPNSHTGMQLLSYRKRKGRVYSSIFIT